jgi:hypothetical protein
MCRSDCKLGQKMMGKSYLFLIIIQANDEDEFNSLKGLDLDSFLYGGKYNRIRSHCA